MEGGAENMERTHFFRGNKIGTLMRDKGTNMGQKKPTMCPTSVFEPNQKDPSYHQTIK